MAKNREPEHIDSDPESGEEETEEDEEETSDEVESEPEPEPTQPVKKPSASAVATGKKPLPQSSTKAQQPPPKPISSSSEEEEEESGSESEPESGGPPRNVKPLEVDPQKSKPKGKAAEPSTPVKSTGAKRSAAEEKEAVEKESKRAKKKAEPVTSGKKAGGANDSSKKVLFQRLWSEDDELAILKGILDYTAKFKSSPLTDLDAFHDFIRKNLHVDVSKAQLQDKMRRLRKKYENNKSKEKDGKDRNFSKAHEQKAYELSKKIWGSDNGKAIEVGKAIGSPKANGGTVKKSSGKRALATVEETKNGNDMEVSHGNLDKRVAAKSVVYSGVSGHERVLSIGAELFEGCGMVEGRNEWKKLMEEEIEIHLKKLDVMRAQAKLVLDGMKSKNH